MPSITQAPPAAARSAIKLFRLEGASITAAGELADGSGVKSVQSLSFDRGLNRAVAGCSDRLLRVWDLERCAASARRACWLAECMELVQGSRGAPRQPPSSPESYPLSLKNPKSLYLARALTAQALLRRPLGRPDGRAAGAPV